MTLRRLWWLAVALLLAPQIQCREPTHEDIRDAIISIVHMMRQSQDKFDRHEFRTKALGEVLKRMLNQLNNKTGEKCHEEIEPLNGMISKLEKRLSNVEDILLRNEGREKNAQENITEALEVTKLSIQTLTTTIENLKLAPENNINLSSNNESIEKRLETIDSTINGIKDQIDSWKKSFNKDSLRSMCFEVASDMNPFKKHITDAEKLLSKYELKLNEYNGTKTLTDIVQLRDLALANEAWHNKMTEETGRQGKEITSIQKLLSDAEGVWKQLPKLSDLHAGTNQTLEAVVKAITVVNDNSEACNLLAINNITTKLSELSDRLLVTTDKEKNKTLSQENTRSEHAYSGNTLNLDPPLQGEVQSQTSDDDVVANKKHIEYGVHQMLTHVSELITLNIIKKEKAMNGTIIDRLNHIEMSVLSHQALIQIDLNSKIQTEIAHVLHEIGIMQKQLDAKQKDIDQTHRESKYHEQTDHYANSSTTATGKLYNDVKGNPDR